jgi:hypothetical protein
MAEEDDDDLYDEEFDFVDDDDVDEKDAEEEEPSADDSDLSDDASDLSDIDAQREGDREKAGGEPAEVKEDEYGRTEPVANYVVHLYEAKKFNRTIDRPFTPEDAEAFATEFNRTGKNYGRMAVTGKNDAKPKKSLD